MHANAGCDLTGNARSADRRSSSNRSYPERERVTELLAAQTDRHVRILSAPVGAGKTAALRHYVARPAAAPPLYAPLGAEASVADFRALVAKIGVDRREVVFDDVDVATPAAARALVDYVLEHGHPRRFIIAGRSARRMHADELIARGVAVELDAAALAYTVDEAAALACTYGLSYQAEDIVQLVHDTDGWAIGIEWVLRSASYEGQTLRHAYDVWRETRGHYLLRYVAAQVESDGQSFAEFIAGVATSGGTAYDELERYQALGYPIIRTRSGLRPYRLLVRLGRLNAAITKDESDLAPMRLKVLGRFRCEIGEREVPFKRRRDRHVFVYAALKNGGRATRDELLAAFWPGTAATVAAQGLRTTLSRIRQAIGEVVGPASVDRYLQTDREIRIDSSLVLSDLAKFQDHVERGDAEFQAERYAIARRYYAAAERQYDDPLLSSEPVEPCFRPQIEAVERTFVSTLRRLIAVAEKANDDEALRRYSRRLMQTSPHDARPPSSGVSNVEFAS